MPKRLEPSDILGLPLPAKNNCVYYDAPGKRGSLYVAGFGLRVTAAGSRTFILNYRTKAGRERRYTIGSPPTWSLNQARDEARKLKAQVDQGGDPLADVKAKRQAKTVRELCDVFAEEHLPSLRPSSADDYRAMMRDKVLPTLGALKVADVRYDDIASLHRKVTRTNKTPYAANRLLALLSKMFALSVRHGWRAGNPCVGVQRNPEVKRDRFLSSEECVRLAQALARSPNQQVADMIRFSLLTGARSRSEVCAARWADFDLVAATWTKQASTTKQKKLHHLPLSAPALQLLVRLRERASPDALLVFPGRQGGIRAGFDYYFKRVCKDAGIKNIRVHDLRHTLGSHLASSGFSLPLIGALLGHSNPNTTARYAHLQVDPQKRAVDRVAGIVLPQGGISDVVPFSRR